MSTHLTITQTWPSEVYSGEYHYSRAPVSKADWRKHRAEKKAEAGQSEPYAYTKRTTELLDMLRYKRPNGSMCEQVFVDTYVAPLGTDPDAFGNHWLTIGDSPILWSCHTDTVHTSGGMQYVGFNQGCAYVKRSSCLGADDTAGVWIMRNMILAGIPGTYVFHRGEECGGLGSNWVLENTPGRLAGLQFAIAFDRMGYSDVITDQWGNTASTAFATSLAAALEPLVYMPDDTGVFTDTQVYSEIIPECSNISVGYHKQHTSNEWLDIDFVSRLLDVMLSADFSGLVCARDPAVEAYNQYYSSRSRYTTATNVIGKRGGSRSSLWDDEVRDMVSNDPWDREVDEVQTHLSRKALDDFCRDYPLVVADYLECCGFTIDDLHSYAGLK